MPIQPTYPGVYVQEESSGVRTIMGVSTSIAAFIGRSLRGPVNDPVVINNFGDFQRLFGDLWYESTMSFSVKDFFLNGGSQAVIVRLFSPVFSDENARKAAFDAALTAATTAAQAVADAAQAAVDEATGPQDIADAVQSAVSGLPGSTAQDCIDAAQAVADAALAAVVPGASLQDVADAAKSAVPDLSGGASQDCIDVAKAMADEAQAAVDAATSPQDIADAAKDAVPNAGSKEIIAAAKAVAAETQSAVVPGASLQVVADAAKSVVDEKADAAANLVAPVAKARINISNLILEAANEGIWGNSLRVRVDHEVNDNIAGLFNLFIRDGISGAVEVIRNVSVEDGAIRRVDHVLKNESNLMRVFGNLPGSKPGPSANPDVGDPWDDTHSTKVTIAATDGNPLVKTDYLGEEGKKTGLYALENADIFNLLCIPPFKTGEDVSSDVWTEAAKYCERRRAMLIIDSPSNWTSKELAKSGIKTGVGTVSSNAAIFFPHINKPNVKRDNQVESFAPCGSVAGVIARTDTQRGVWKAPAGLDANLNGVLQLSVSLTDGENGELNPLGINCLRSIPPSGMVIWGSRTLQGDDRLTSEWKYIPVRRTALYIEETLYRNLKWVVFEPNDEALWAQIRLNVGAFMHDLFVQGAFQGTNPRDAYFVKCDKETTTQNDINKGVVNIWVGFAPLKPAEFVMLYIQQMAGKINT